MKKIIALITFSLILGTVAYSQDIRFGFQMSPSFSWMTTNTNKVNRSGTNLGLKLGMLGEYYFRENYAFVSGIGFAFNHGGTLLHEFGGNYWTKSDLDPNLQELPPDVKLKYGIQYVEIPAGLKMRTREFGYLRYFLEPGLTFGFKTQARGSIKGTGIGDDAEKINIRKEVNSLNLAWGLGGGVEYSISDNTSLVGGLGFQIGFTDATDDNGTVFDTNQKVERGEKSKGTISAITLKIGVMF
jgi:opacity protein-like surface antigen